MQGSAHKNVMNHAAGTRPGARRRAATPAADSAWSGLQQSVGNQRLIGLLQRKLSVSQPDDPYEQEADRVADEIMRLPAPGGGPAIQRMCAGCEEELRREAVEEEEVPQIQEKPEGSPSSDTASHTASFVASLAGRGEPLPDAVRRFMEPRFNADFSAVRVHTGPEAHRSAEEVRALAYTTGSHIVFRNGYYDPASDSGKRLLAHELTHVVQQGSAPGALRPAAIQRLGDLARRPPALDGRCPVPATSAGPPTEVIEFGNRVTSLAALDIARIEHVVQNWHAAGGTETVRVDGFASTRGSEELNWELSCARAEAVVAELLNPSSGDPGIPASFIEIYAQGETSEFGSEERNRCATITLSGGTAPAPSTEPSRPAPAFVCGPDVTTQVVDACDLTKRTFAGWTSTQQTDACDALDSLTTGGFAWDITDLHNNAWILLYRPDCATRGATPPCGSSVQVHSDCHYAGSANYVIFGVMCKLCHDHFTALGSSRASDFTEAEMLDLINLYKGTGPFGISTPSANFVPSQNWATAGYRGWPGVPDPAGDRSGCSPTCPTPYRGTAFMVHWHPMGVF